MTNRRSRFRRKPKPGSDTNDASAPHSPEPAKTAVSHLASTSARVSSAGVGLNVAGSSSPIPSPNPSAALSIPGCSPDMNNAQSLWSVAFKKLADKDQQIFSLASFDPRDYLEMLLDSAKKQKRECDEKKWKFEFRGKVIELRELADKVIDWLEKFKAVGDVMVQFDPVHAALPWGAVRFLLQIAINDKQAMGLVLVGVEKIAGLLGRCTAYEELYLKPMPHLIKLYETLTDLYAAILEFLAGAMQYFKEPWAKNFIKTLLSPAAKKTLLDAIDEKESSLSKEITIVEARSRKNDHSSVEGKLQLLLDNWNMPLKMIQSIDERITSMHVRMEEQERLGILQWISAVKYDDHHMNAKSGLLENTGEWLFQNSRFEEWRSSTSSGFIWLQGKPGAGKTKLTCKVIDALRSKSRNEPVVFFYCNRAEQPRRDPSVILHTLLKQLSVHLPSPNLPKLIKDAYMPVKEGGNASSQWELQKCQDLLLSLSEIYPRTTLMIDALDEIETDQREVLLEALNKIVQSSQSILKMFISSRKYQDIQKALDCDSISAIDNDTDIQRFVEREVTKLIEKHWEHLSDKNALTQDIVSALVSKADGMFLWVDLQIKLLSRSKLESGIRRDLGNLPKTLETTYRQIYHDTILAAPGNEPEVIKKALGWIMVAQRLLTPQEWVGATEKATQDSLDFHSLLELCHNLVANDTESNVIRYIHLSAREYMEAQADFNLPRLHTMAAHACLSVLIDAQPPSPKPRTTYWAKPKSKTFIDYAREYWAHHVERSDDKYMKENTLKLIRTFLGIPEEPSESYQKYIEFLARKKSPYETFHGESYGRACRSVQAVPQNPLFAVSFFSLGRLCTDLWDWSNVNFSSRNRGGDSVLTVASRVGNDAMVRLVLDRCTDIVCDALPWSDDPLAAAVRHDQSKVVTTLLSYRADIAAKLCQSHNPLDDAARRGTVAVVQAVLSCRDLGIRISASTLLAAAENWDHGENILQFLLDSDKRLPCSQKVATKVVEHLTKMRLRNIETRLSVMQQFLDKGWEFELELSEPSIGRLISDGGNQALDWLLNHGTWSSMITGDVIFKVASLTRADLLSRRAKSTSPDSLVALIERCPKSNLELLKSVLQRATVRDARLVNLILDRYPNINPPNSVLIPLARAGKPEGRLISILDHHPDMEISEHVLIVAASARGSAFEMLLARDRSIEISESVLEASAKYGRIRRVEMILEREPGLKPTDRILEAVARGRWFVTFGDEVTDDEETDDQETDDQENGDEEPDAVKVMKLLLAHNDELQISDRVLQAVLSGQSGYDERLTYKKMKFLLSRPGVVISESVLIAVLDRNFGSVELLRLMLAGNFDVNILTSEAVLVAAARSRFHARELLELLLKSATDAKTKVKEKKTEAPIETQQEFPSLLPKDSKVYIKEKVLVAAAQGGLDSIKYLLGYDPEIRITRSIADAILLFNERWGLEIRRVLLSEFKENLTQEALEKLENPQAHSEFSFNSGEHLLQ